MIVLMDNLAVNLDNVKSIEVRATGQGAAIICDEVTLYTFRSAYTARYIFDELVCAWTSGKTCYNMAKHIKDMMNNYKEVIR